MAMKKITLLAGLALLAGGAFAADGPTIINGVKISTDEQKYYYRIGNMRAERMSYITGKIYGQDGYDDKDVVGENRKLTALGVNLPATLPDGEPMPDIYTFPYMGLANMAGSWYASFSAQEDVMNPYTTYWYFTQGKKEGSVVIHNAVMDGSIRRESRSVEGIDGVKRKNVGFDLTNWSYYVIPAMEGPEPGMGLNDCDWADQLALSPEQKASAYVFSTEPTYDANSNCCLEMNDYITFTMWRQRIDNDGEPMFDANDEPVNDYYGFAGLDVAWNPFRSVDATESITNNNRCINNGTLFFLTEQPEEDVLKAIEYYQDYYIPDPKRWVVAEAKQIFSNAIMVMEGWVNVPVLWSDAAALHAIIDYCLNWNGEGLDPDSVVSLETHLAYMEGAKRLADEQLAKAAALVGKGTVITLQNQLAFRDVEDCENMEASEREAYQLGNAYISAGGKGSVYTGEYVIEANYSGIVPTLEATDKSQWTLIQVEGTPTFLLYNEATKTYIRQYRDMYELAGGDGEFGSKSDCSDFSWATTANKDEAAPFRLIGCDDPENQTEPTEDEEVVIIDLKVPTDITNNVRLQSQYTPEPENDDDDYVYPVYTNIHRSTAINGYSFINLTPLKNWWYADPNIFKVAIAEEGGISEIAADTAGHNAGIYDLQGRRVAKAGKGLFIVNGVKTIMR